MNINKQSPAFKGAFSVRIPYIGNNTRRMKALTKYTYKIFDDMGARVVQTKVNSGSEVFTTRRMPVASTINAIVPDKNDSFTISRLNRTVANKEKLKNEAAVVNYTNSVGDNFPDDKIAGEVLSLLW